MVAIKHVLSKLVVKVIVSCFLSIGLVAILSSQVQILISNSDSLPEHYFLCCRHLTPKLNNYSVVWSDWYKNRVIKKIVGVSGDRIWYDQYGQLLVNKEVIGVPQTRTTDGRRLHPITAQVILDGLVFLAGSHPRSFDSRYQEFGLVPINKLGGLVIPLL